jgi:glycosyltransferase involved in cell wall biosynthesis
MRIGIYFTSTKLHGGIYQYSTTLLEALSKIPGNNYVIFSVSKDIPDNIRKNKNFKIIEIGKGSYGLTLKIRDILSYMLIFWVPNLMKTLYRMRLFYLLTPFYKFTQRGYLKILEKENPDLMFYTTSANFAFLSSIPAVAPVHDIMHRVHPNFPEVSAGGRWESREYSFQNIADHAFRVLVDSDIGKEDMIKYYHPHPSKIVVLPFLPPTYLDKNISIKEAKEICSKLGIPNDFAFYPAKFWPHKNHINLIKALKELKKTGRNVNLVLTGSSDAEFSVFKEVFNLVKKYSLEDKIYYLGYVNDKQISALYKLARVMVMPDYFGPTNIPIYEAWAMGTPAIASDLRGCRDQLGDAGLLVDPDNPKDIAQKIWMIYNNRALANKLSQKGKQRLNKWTYKDFSKEVKNILNDFKKSRYVKSKNN